VLEREPTVSIELEWGRPTQTYGDLLGYRLRYGVKDQVLIEQVFKGIMVHSHKINDLGKMNWCLSKVVKYLSSFVTPVLAETERRCPVGLLGCTAACILCTSLSYRVRFSIIIYIYRVCARVIGQLVL
jgi:hypothetical protein